jgi:hypothetical protein
MIYTGYNYSEIGEEGLSQNNYIGAFIFWLISAYFMFLAIFYNEDLKPKRLYSKKYDSYAIWNGAAWEDPNTGAYFYTIEKANNNGYYYV